MAKVFLKKVHSPQSTVHSRLNVITDSFYLFKYLRLAKQNKVADKIYALSMCLDSYGPLTVDCGLSQY